jgi:lactose/L-arabinose transport system ATP-binding protein
MIAGLEETTEGEIRIGGRDVTRADPAERGVAMVFQTYALYPHMTVEENMGFGLKMTGTPKAEIDAKVSHAAEILQLGPYLQRKPKALSGGQRQRVAIGRAITRGPDVFLFDEPLSNLDAELRVDMRVEIKRLHETLGNTMIYVTHDQVEAMTLADKIVVLRAGHIEQVGSPMDLYQDPDNVFVGGFIGSPSMNFLKGTVTAAGTVSVHALDGQEIETTVTLPNEGSEVLVGMRPQELGVHEEESSLKVEIRERLGGVAYDYLRATTGERIVVEIKGNEPIAEGTTVGLDFNPENTFFFDAKTSLRLR